MTREMKTELRSDVEVAFIRRFDAPRALVFEAWTDPGHMAMWWGPATFTAPVCESDARPGGAWRVVMRSPDGVDYPLKGVYREFVRPERLVMSVDLSEHPDDWFDMLDANRDKAKGKPELGLSFTVTFDERNGTTTLTVLTRFASRAIRDAMIRMGMEQGWGDMLERLATLLAKR